MNFSDVLKALSQASASDAIEQNVLEFDVTPLPERKSS